MALVFIALAILELIVILAVTMGRRKDFGRRRAFGASRALILELQLMQLMQLGAPAVIGTLVGTASAVAVLALSGDSLPGAAYLSAMSIAAVFTALLAGLPPALYAANGDPARELRVP